MSFVPLLTLDDWFNNVEELCNFTGDLTEFQSVVHDYRITHTSIGDLEFTEAMMNDLLRLLTTFVVSTQTDVSCYPVGYVTTLLFDINGDPIT